MEHNINFVILTVSDTNTENAESAEKLKKCIKESFPENCILHREIVRKEVTKIKELLTFWSSRNCDVILTTGGTGFAPKDVTPEATRAVITREAPGWSYAMFSKSLEIDDMAMLSRAICGIRYKTIIINLPGNIETAIECFGFVKNSIPEIISLLKNDATVVQNFNSDIQCSESVTPSKVVVNQVAFRNGNMLYPMMEMNIAIELIKKYCSNIDLATEIVELPNCRNRVLAEVVMSKTPVPPFDSATKDGYAVRSDDGSGIRKVHADDIQGSSLEPGEIIRISTGACIPNGANAVVEVEDTALVASNGSTELLVEVKVWSKPFQNIRLCGSDLSNNTEIMKPGDCITSAHIGVLASVGRLSVTVYERTKIVVLSTGNDLQHHEEVLKQSHIYDSNKLTLINLLAEYGYEAHDGGVVKDDPDSIKQQFTLAMKKHDVIISTGRLLTSPFDVVKQVLIQDFDAVVHFGRVNLESGKLTTFATCKYEGKTKYIFGLPGNPVSAMVSCILFVLPGLQQLEMRKGDTFERMLVSLGENINLNNMPEMARVKLTMDLYGDDLPRAHLVGNQTSSKLNSFIGADGLLYLPCKEQYNKKVAKKGKIFKMFILRH